MNILGYISAILILIGIAFQGYYSSWFVDRKLQDNLKGYHTAFRNLEKKYINQTFDSIPEKKGNKQTAEKPNSSDNNFKPLKKELTPYCMRLNLWLYKNINVNNAPNFSILERLITILYGDKLIAKKDILKFTKNLIIAIQSKKSETIHLEQLKFKDIKDQEVYYQMLKGKQHAYPSFLNYAYIKIDSKPKICIACADFVILTSLFNEQIAKTLMFRKENPLEQIIIDKDSFYKMITSYNTKKENSPHFSLKHRKSNLKEITIISKEQKTQIQLKQKMNLNLKKSKKNNLARKS